MIDPREVHELRRAADEFEAGCGPRPPESAVRFMQAARRVVMLGTESADRRAWLKAASESLQRHPTPPPASIPTGDPCAACGGPMVRTGTCKTCQHCGASGGCG